ncbi:19965_t:CDS:2 [Cetraspora pellucida]|uniref:19965_t:CDS:1 n=1 Tax=Cetraspora pellucida TaxID=1433469 RepID=A0A9N9B9Z1_9GLOM|nr:19965_t:CDS:2 [Cetraspora pellucida]
MESMLEDYDVSPATGFLPSTPPLQRLPSYYEPWEALLDNFHDLMLAGRLRSSINKLLVLDTIPLKTLAEYHRAFLVLSSLAHGYVWGKFDEVSDITSLHCQAMGQGIRSPSNLATLFTFSNTPDESWFYLVTTAIEGFGGRAITAIMSAIRAIKAGNNQKLIVALRDINSTIVDINATLQRMHEKCDPYVFYLMVRPYLSGWENEDRLPHGLIYEGVDDNDENGNPIYRKYVGASAGQSALIQALDIALNIEHYPTGVKSSINGHCPMKNYTSGNDLAKVANIRNYIISQTSYDSSITTISSPDEDMDMLQGTNEMVQVYNECLNQMKNFRSKHLQIVSVYIIIQAHRGNGDSRYHLPINKDVATSKNEVFRITTNNVIANNKEATTTVKPTTTKSVEIKGTGGTNLIPFLKQMRDETMLQEIQNFYE